MMLALFRYLAVCHSTNSRFTDIVKGRPSTLGIILIFLGILVPAIIFSASMYFGISATGKMWSFMPILNPPNSTDVITVMAYQHVDKNKRGSGTVVVIIMSCLLALQTLVTFFLYASICYTAYKSTMNVALKNNSQHEHSLNTTHPMKHRTARKESSNQNNTPEDIELQDIKSADEVKFLPEKRDTDANNSKNSDGSKCNNIRENYNISNGPESKYKVSCKAMDEIETKNPSQPTNTDSDAIEVISVETVRVKDQGTSGGFEPCEKKKHKVFLPTADDYKSVIPISGAKLVAVPLTKFVLCVSRHDIVCTASLTSQIVCLLITHVLTVFGFRISGEMVSIDAYDASTFAFEIAFLINTLVDPFICIIFSTSYRCAALEFLKRTLNEKRTYRRKR